MKLMVKFKTLEKVKITKVIIIIITTAIAIIIASLTVGHELYNEGRNQSLISFAVVHFSGYLFFLLMPVEMAFIYYLSYFQTITLVLVALSTAVLAQIIDYLIGRSFSPKFLSNLAGEKRILKAEDYIFKYGNLTIFIFNLLPLSSPLIALAAGILRFRFKNLMLYSLFGLILKYVILGLIF